MLQNTAIEQFLMLDIETVPGASSYEQLDNDMQALWQAKHEALRITDMTAAESFEKKAGIYAEFGKIVCISVGYFSKKGDRLSLRLRSICGDDERKLLQELAALLDNHFHKEDYYVIAGHNVKEFDIPYLCRRMMINNIALPYLLHLSGKKPWETSVVDTMHLWRFGDYKSYTSLKLMAHVLGIPSPKEDMEGKDVGNVYWQQKQLPRITEYCQRDVVTVARLLLRFKELPITLSDDDVVIR
jgi:DNA polymerase elongation subunit (family B)